MKNLLVWLGGCFLVKSKQIYCLRQFFLPSFVRDFAMITGLQRTGVDSLLDALRVSQFEFVLTGSRFFGNAFDKSDWDFMAADCSELTIFLEKHGFKLPPDSMQESNINIDSDDIQRYAEARRHGHFVAIYFSPCNHIQIQVMQDKNALNHKIMIQNKLKASRHFPLYGMKNERSKFWSFAYELLPEQKQSLEDVAP